MNTTSSSLSDFLYSLNINSANIQEVLLKLSQVLSTTSDTVSLSQTASDGTKSTYLIPSFGYLSNKLINLENTLNSLINLNSNQIGITDSSGNTKRFELKSMSNLVSTFNTIATSKVTIPESFNYKTNWFFESFLNPLLYVNIDTSSIITDPDINKFEVIRLIYTSNSEADSQYFDSNYKGNNSINYLDLISDLTNRGIDYFEDISESTLPPATNMVSGSFSVLNILEDSSTTIIAGETLSESIVKYKLNTIWYNDLSNGNAINKSLQVGDFLLHGDSEYKIASIDINSKTVILQLVFGKTGIAVGSSLLIKPNLVRPTSIQLNVGYNERNIIFLKPVSDRLAITANSYSNGFGIYTNDLLITLSSGETITLSDFYNRFVSDFGLLFINYAKEKKMPAVLGSKPNAVFLNSSNFKVIQIDEHIQDADNTNTIKQKISAKEQISTQISEIDRQISSARSNLNTNASLNEAQRLKLEKDLKTYADTRSTLSKSQQSLISDITSSIKVTPSFITTPSYRVRGFWPIPEVKNTIYGQQSVVQFKVAYRVLSKTGNTKSADQLEIINSDNSKTVCVFSPWTEFLTKARTKTYNESTGFYTWLDESVSDPDIINSNQLDIPIKKGETVEIRIKSLSEAGWPDNPVESDWSNSVYIEFPASIESTEESSILSQQMFAEESRLAFQDELNSKGLDLHLGSSFTTRDKYYPHKAEDISSGFFGTDGNIIDMYTKLKNLTDTLSAIQTSIATGRGQLTVSIVDQEGNVKAVSNGQTIELFAGYYKDLIKDSSVTPVVYNHGKVVATQYLIQLQNSSQTPLQLIATLSGGVGEPAPSSDPIAYPNIGYHTSLRYDICPLSINTNIDSTIGGISQKDGYQSSQVKSQYIHSRYKNIALSEILYSGDNLSASQYYSVGNYDYTGKTIGTSLVPYEHGHYLPFDPTLETLSGSQANSNVWNGTVANSIPNGNGLLSEFCIHVNHPYIVEGGEYNTDWNMNTYNIARPTYSNNDTIQKYLPFSHGIHFETSESEGTNVFGAKYYQQAQYIMPNQVILGEPSVNMRESQYPIKNGFLIEDEYLIGKYTCGAYLTLNPASHSTISVTGLSPAGSTTLLEYGDANAIKIPLIFQFRASDKLGYIGGWRSNTPSGLKNIKYTKKIGLDIYSLNSVFSFDIIVRTQYEKVTAITTPVSELKASSVGIKANT